MGSLGEKCVNWGNVVKGESPYSNPPNLLASFLRRSASWLGAPLLCAFLPGYRILLPISPKRCLAGVASFALIWVASASASAALPIAPLVALAATRAGALSRPLLLGPRQKHPPALLLALGRAWEAAPEPACSLAPLAWNLAFGLGLHAAQLSK